jgi:hypothetical protein
MSQVNAILTERMKKPANVSKMAEMARQSASGNLTSFSGLFQISELSVKEKASIEELLSNYAAEQQEIQTDLSELIAITAEVKAINNQAALLHGERIKKAHQILIRYRDGAFTAWLVATYGNRQTPYNLMQYYEFCEAMPKQLRSQIEMMPRQSIYVLATRVGSLERKRQIVESYQGETKDEMLEIIRKAFPLEQADKRQHSIGHVLLKEAKKLYQKAESSSLSFTSLEKKQLIKVLNDFKDLVEQTP